MFFDFIIFCFVPEIGISCYDDNISFVDNTKVSFISLTNLLNFPSDISSTSLNKPESEFCIDENLINNKNLEIEQMKLKNFRNNLIIGFFGIVIVILLVFYLIIMLKNY